MRKLMENAQRICFYGNGRIPVNDIIITDVHDACMEVFRNVYLVKDPDCIPNNGIVYRIF